MDGQEAIDDRRPPPAGVLGCRTPRRETSPAAGASRRPDEPVGPLGEARPSVDAARRPGVGRVQETGTRAIAQPLPPRPRLAAALTGQDLTELVADEEIDDEVDGRVDGQQDVGDAVGAVYERIHVFVAGDELLNGDDQSQDDVGQLADDEDADDGDEHHRDVVVKSGARCQAATTHAQRAV